MKVSVCPGILSLPARARPRFPWGGRCRATRGNLAKNTFAWLRKGKSHTSLEENAKTAPVLELLRRADAWLAANGPVRNPILKWKTEIWGEIPADFGRK